MECIRIWFALISMLCLVSCPAIPEMGILNVSGGEVRIIWGSRDILLPNMEEISLMCKGKLIILRGAFRSDAIEMMKLAFVDVSNDSNKKYIQESMLYGNGGHVMIHKLIIKPDMNIYAGFSLKDDSGGGIHIYRHQPFGFPMRLK